MQGAMNSFTGSKIRKGELMADKKNRGRFTIKFNEHDPGHKEVIQVLESQGQHSKAQFIASAVLHYIHCPQTGDLPVSQAVAMDRAMVEAIVLDILKRKEETEYIKEAPKDDIQAAEEEKETKAEEMELSQPMDDTTKALIADTISFFRNS